MPVHFDQLFQSNPDGSFSPRTVVGIANGGGSVTLTPGVAFRPGIAFMGVDISTLKGRTLEVQDQGGIKMITGVYP